MTLNARFIIVRLVDGTLDVRLLRVSDSTILCIDEAREGEGGGLRVGRPNLPLYVGS